MTEIEIKKFLKELKEYGIDNEIPNISETSAKFLQDLIAISGAKNVLEIGTANGYSTINLALACKKNSGKVVSIEFSANSHNQARKNIFQVGLSDYTELVNANALDYIPTFQDDFFDFIFIDGMKRRSMDFLDLSRPKLKKGGFVIIDDVIKFKDKMLSLYEYIEKKVIEYNILPLDSDDGVMMIVKRGKIEKIF
ncbi:MAG: class I SAM-dependent methyltransferase [Candidatus Gracilibacteria bacterium]|nr:class I SAM-dependent methyltransferase [Candidatus Gracilibacteria bacterium]